MGCCVGINKKISKNTKKEINNNSHNSHNDQNLDEDNDEVKLDERTRAPRRPFFCYPLS